MHGKSKPLSTADVTMAMWFNVLWFDWKQQQSERQQVERQHTQIMMANILPECDLSWGGGSKAT